MMASSTRRERDKLCVDGYNRICMKELKIVVPMKLLDLMLLFYHLQYIMIEWSSVYKTDTVLLSTDNKVVKSPIEMTHNHVWIIAKDPVIEGIHCWRLFVNNPKKDGLHIVSVNQMSLIQMAHLDKET